MAKRSASRNKGKELRQQRQAKQKKQQLQLYAIGAILIIVVLAVLGWSAGNWRVRSLTWPRSH